MKLVFKALALVTFIQRCLSLQNDVSILRQSDCAELAPTLTSCLDLIDNEKQRVVMAVRMTMCDILASLPGAWNSIASLPQECVQWRDAGSPTDETAPCVAALYRIPQQWDCYLGNMREAVHRCDTKMRRRLENTEDVLSRAVVALESKDHRLHADWEAAMERKLVSRMEHERDESRSFLHDFSTALSSQVDEIGSQFKNVLESLREQQSDEIKQYVAENNAALISSLSQINANEKQKHYSAEAILRKATQSLHANENFMLNMVGSIMANIEDERREIKSDLAHMSDQIRDVQESFSRVSATVDNLRDIWSSVIKSRFAHILSIIFAYPWLIPLACLFVFILPRTARIINIFFATAGLVLWPLPDSTNLERSIVLLTTLVPILLTTLYFGFRILIDV